MVVSLLVESRLELSRTCKHQHRIHNPLHVSPISSRDSSPLRNYSLDQRVASRFRVKSRSIRREYGTDTLAREDSPKEWMDAPLCLGEEIKKTPVNPSKQNRILIGGSIIWLLLNLQSISDFDVCDPHEVFAKLMDALMNGPKVASVIKEIISMGLTVLLAIKGTNIDFANVDISKMTTCWFDAVSILKK
jgi:hypothetical protein